MLYKVLLVTFKLHFFFKKKAFCWSMDFYFTLSRWSLQVKKRERQFVVESFFLKGGWVGWVGGVGGPLSFPILRTISHSLYHPVLPLSLISVIPIPCSPCWESLLPLLFCLFFSLCQSSVVPHSLFPIPTSFNIVLFLPKIFKWINKIRALRSV